MQKDTDARQHLLWLSKLKGVVRISCCLTLQRHSGHWPALYMWYWMFGAAKSGPLRIYGCVTLFTLMESQWLYGLQPLWSSLMPCSSAGPSTCAFIYWAIGTSFSERRAPFSVRAESISHYGVSEGNGLEEGKRNNLIYYGNTDPWMCLCVLLRSQVKLGWNSLEEMKNGWIFRKIWKTQTTKIKK